MKKLLVLVALFALNSVHAIEILCLNSDGVKVFESTPQSMTHYIGLNGWTRYFLQYSENTGVSEVQGGYVLRGVNPEYDYHAVATVDTQTKMMTLREESPGGYKEDSWSCTRLTIR